MSNAVPKRLPPSSSYRKSDEHSSAIMPVTRVANAPNQAGRRQHTSLRLISCHLIPVSAMNDATVDMTQEDPPPAIETSLADLATTFAGNFIPNNRSPAPNHTGSHDLVSQTAVTCVFSGAQKKEVGRIE